MVGPTHNSLLRFTLRSDIARRDSTVSELLQLVLDEHVVQIRGTPMTGKTVLSKLLLQHGAQCLTNLGWDVVYLTWMETGSSSRQGKSLSEFLSQHSYGRAKASDILGSEKPLLFTIDEAQLSYKDEAFWLSCVKEQAGGAPSPNLYLALLSPHGSASATALQIPGSSPIQLKGRQRGWSDRPTWLAT